MIPFLRDSFPHSFLTSPSLSFSPMWFYIHGVKNRSKQIGFYFPWIILLLKMYFQFIAFFWTISAYFDHKMVGKCCCNIPKYTMCGLYLLGKWRSSQLHCSIIIIPSFKDFMVKTNWISFSLENSLRENQLLV